MHESTVARLALSRQGLSIHNVATQLPVSLVEHQQVSVYPQLTRRYRRVRSIPIGARLERDCLPVRSSPYDVTAGVLAGDLSR